MGFEGKELIVIIVVYWVISGYKSNKKCKKWMLYFEDFIDLVY